MAKSTGVKFRVKLLSCKRDSQIATFNARTLRADEKCLELVKNFNQCKLDILGINDHKIVHDEPILMKELDQCMLITTSAWRNASNAGVGILVSKDAETAISEVKPITNRILVVYFSGNPNTTIVIHYAPTEGSDNAEEQYSNLSNTINVLPKHDFIIELGDFNAHLGEDIARYTYHENSNSNGKLMHAHAIEAALCITNTLFQKRKGKMWTSISDMNLRKTQIDFILVNKKWKNSVRRIAVSAVSVVTIS